MRQIMTQARLLALSTALLIVMATSSSGWYKTCLSAKAGVDITRMCPCGARPAAMPGRCKGEQ
jgi:hypothetical protein